MAKSPISMLVAIGKKPDGAKVEEEEITETPDQAGEEAAEIENQTINLPKGFKMPETTTEGESFTTSLRGKIVDGNKFVIEAVGDMPMHSEATETPQDEASESPEERKNEEEAGMEEYSKKSQDEAAMRKAFS